MLSIEDLSFSFKRREKLLNSLNMEMTKGKIYGLFGLNGAGKTTLLNIISGMLFPKKGVCKLDGNNTRFRSPDTLSRLFIVPEQFDLPKISGRKYVNLHDEFYPAFDHSLFEQAIDEFEVDLQSQLPELSFGQRKKFLIAFAIATQTRLLLLDEPTNGLDIPSKSQFRKIVAGLNLEDRCIVISTHQVRDLGSMIDHILVLNNGSITFDHGLDLVHEQLAFKLIEPGSSETYLYGEESLGGIKAIVAAGDHAGDAPDLELLFNGIIKNAEVFNQQLNGVLS